MELRILFSGMCLFTPRPAAGGRPDLMHVLLPRVQSAEDHVGHDHHGIPRHVPVLQYDQSYLIPSSPLPSGMTVQFKMTDWVLDIGGTGASQRLCRQIVNLRDVTGRPVHDDHLGTDETAKVTSRITLAAGRMTRVAPGVCWEWEPGQLRRIAHMAEWTIEALPDAPLTLTLTRLHGLQVTKTITLHPIAGAINIAIHHLPLSDLPLDPDPMRELRHGDSPEHFKAYYRLFGGPVPVRLPKYWGAPSECPPVHPDDCPTITNMGGSPFTCMIAGSEP